MGSTATWLWLTPHAMDGTKGRNRVAVDFTLWTMTQGSAFRATLGFGSESRWDSARRWTNWRVQRWRTSGSSSTRAGVAGRFMTRVARAIIAGRQTHAIGKTCRLDARQSCQVVTRQGERRELPEKRAGRAERPMAEASEECASETVWLRMSRSQDPQYRPAKISRVPTWPSK